MTDTDRILVRRSPYRSYAVAIFGVATAFLLRLIVQPIVGENHPYSLFLPVILFCAYAYGRGPALTATALSSGLAYWTFAEPRFGIGGGFASTAPLALFVLTSLGVVFAITELTKALQRQAADQGHMHALADMNASLFRALQARISYHMSAVVGVLTLQARGEPDPVVMRALHRIGERSALIATTYRDLAGDETGEVDFPAFARSLIQAMEAESGRLPSQVTVYGERLMISREAATTLGIALLECVGWLLRHHPDAQISLHFSRRREQARVFVSVGEGGPPVLAIPSPAPFLFMALVQQLGARARLAPYGSDGPGVELLVPLQTRATIAPGPLH